MDEKSLNDLDVKVVIISRGRAKTCNTQNILPNCVPFLVPESQRSEYENSVPDRKIEVLPDDVVGLGKVRNWCLDNYSETTVIMVDDDLYRIYDLTGDDSRQVCDKDEALAIILSLSGVAKDMGVHWFGFRNLDIRKYSNFDPFALNESPSGIVGVIGRKYRFRDDKYKVDIDMTLQNLLSDRICLVDRRYSVLNKMMGGVGGNTSTRTEAELKRSVQSLKDRWGEYLSISWTKSDISIRLDVPRKERY